MLLKVISGKNLEILLLKEAYIAEEIQAMVDANQAIKTEWEKAITISFCIWISVGFCKDGFLYVSLIPNYPHHKIELLNTSIVCVVNPEEGAGSILNPLFCQNKCYINSGIRRTATGRLSTVDEIDYSCLQCHDTWTISKSR